MAKALEAAGNKPTKKAVVRSPKYPLLTFSDALAKVKVIYDYEKRSKTTPAVALSHIGYSTQIGLPARVLSALLQYGLLEKSSNRVSVSDRAFRIFNLPEDSEERATLIREAALRPALFRDILREYPTGLPSDATLKSYLVINKEFNENTIGQFLKVFKAAIDVAKPFDGSYTEADSDKETDYDGVDEGDEDMSISPEGIRKLQPVDARKPSGQGAPLPPYMLQPLAPGQKELNLSISRESQARIIFTGPVTQEAIAKLAALLELQKDTFPTSDELEHPERKGMLDAAAGRPLGG